MDSDVGAAFLAGGGLLSRRLNPSLARRLDRLREHGTVCSPLPGVFATAPLETPEARIAAGVLWSGPDTVICGAAAARLTFWPECRVADVELAVPIHAKASRPGWRLSQRPVPEQLIWQRGRWRTTSAALTAVDLAGGPIGGEAIDRVLRARAASLAQLWAAYELTPSRPGNRLRRALLHDSRDQPWSEAERELHRLLRTAGITGWTTNTWIGDDRSGYFADVCFDPDRLILEVDGFETHGGRSAFEADRRRRNALVLAGFTVLNFTWRQLVEDPGWVIDCVGRARGQACASPRPGRRSGR